VKAVADWNKY